ncbi:TrpB-like pyridoxal phosphate-dependent enzyme [Antrihabitans cavernicola]|uniref:tryptophan synthase n=1 Tax=Antrihabitans cavernicola TaxID=2495913 RepID=A0A5A7S1I1_9NOCA|nr:TrpB-like pyridoxal phosphate-dependent enzyme [Spelaeibacter cavernicola]KAA0017031.1 TrpB-like pyridoxal phosphate-dependent enzyme [Spelaeibacter cavernicola]
MNTLLDRVDLPLDQMPKRWYNGIPALPTAPEPYIDSTTDAPVTLDYVERLWTKAMAAQEFSLDRWISIPQPVLDAYAMWRPTPLIRAVAMERYLDTPAQIWFKYEATSPSGSHKLNSALAQAYYAKREGHSRLVTDTGAGQWGSALALACQMFGLDLSVFMVRASYHQKPYRRYLMETYGAQVHPSPGVTTEYGRGVLADNPDHPGSEATAVSESLETVRADPAARMSVGAFSNHCLLHQTIIGLELREQLAMIDRYPDYLVASVGCGSNMAGLSTPFMEDKLNGSETTFLAVEPEACAPLTYGEYRFDYADAAGSGPGVCTYTLGHEFVPPPIHAGGLRYHGCAPLIGQMRHQGILDSVAYPQTQVFDAGVTFARLHGFLPAPETCHAIKGVIDLALQCKEQKRDATIVFNYSGHGLLDLEAYGRYNAGELRDVEVESFDEREAQVVG